MTTESQQAEPSAPKSGIVVPARKLHTKYIEPILYLADRMARSDKEVAASERHTVDALAAKAGQKGFRTKAWFRDLDDDTACQRLDIDAAKRGCLVVLTLVLKVDLKKRPEEHDYFHKLRVKLGADPIIVPVDLEEHRKLAHKYIG